MNSLNRARWNSTWRAPVTDGSRGPRCKARRTRSRCVMCAGAGYCAGLGFQPGEALAGVLGLHHMLGKVLVIDYVSQHWALRQP